MAQAQAQAPAAPFVRIVEQPASKALRFRYQCEGRSAGSIPGVNSTSDKKSFPTIEIVGHKGRAIVVVSCVTKDPPYRPHPHNLVGRDRCSKGVCTVKPDLADSSLVSFSNLGIQCVKRKDVEDALEVREELNVDPFKTGYDHKKQPQSIDLNAVRLCFQVFLPDGRTGKYRHSLPPVVSEVIYDKKAMSDLQIMRVSRCSGSVRGDTEIILLCEKVTREDIAVVFLQKDESGAVVWEQPATILLVHKQFAIDFKTPPYHDLAVSHHVHVYFQLKRPSDNARSEALPFEYIPEAAGTARKPLPDLGALAPAAADPNNNTAHTDTPPDTDSSDTISPSPDAASADITVDLNGNLETDKKEKSISELLDQVAELDEIYSESRARLHNAASANENDSEPDDFNDAGTYTSLQLAFRNPISISDPEPYEDVDVQTYRGPIIEFTPLKSHDDDRAPPLPPKRVRKTSGQDSFKTSQTSVDSILKPGRQLPVTRNADFAKRDHVITVARSEPALPPVKKRSFFARLFRRKEKSPAPSVKSEGKVDSKKSRNVGRSVSSVSGQRPSKYAGGLSQAQSTGALSYADSITHISLHADIDKPPRDSSNTILVAESVLALDASEFRKLQDDYCLTDAEHYALYMAVAPRATASEMDDTSQLYAPVDTADLFR